MSTYPDQININVISRIHLEHTDKSPDEHKTIQVQGEVQSFPNTGEYHVELEPADQTPFAAITSGPCIVVVILVILDWPKPANSKVQQIREDRELPDPVNFLDLSDGEYEAILRMDFEDGYAFKVANMQKLTDVQYQVTIDTYHRYPSTKSDNIIKILPHDLVLTDGGPGKLFGRCQARWLKSDNSILTGDASVQINLKKEYKRLCFPQVFSYEYDHVPFDEYPFTLDAIGTMRVIDTSPEIPE